LINSREFLAYAKTDPSDLTILPTDWNGFAQGNFDKVLWTYSRDYNLAKLTCNGIIIPNGFDIAARDYGQEIYDPKVAVFDSNGLLNLTLNRNSLSANQLPFEQELYIEVAKDLIAYILTFDTAVKCDNTKIEISKSSLKHPSIYKDSGWGRWQGRLLDLIYLRSGFTLDNSFCINKIQSDFIHTLYFFEDSNFKISLPKDINLIRLEFSYDQTVSSLANALDFYRGGRISIVRDLYDKMFKSKTKTPRIRRGLLNDHIIEDETKNWATYSYLFDSNANYKLSEFGPSLKNLSIIKEEKCFKQEVDDALFNELLQKYLGDDPIIPYDLSLRKNKFLNAFSELEPYIAKYLKE
jgi:hypothetical protein